MRPSRLINQALLHLIVGIFSAPVLVAAVPSDSTATQQRHAGKHIVIITAEREYLTDKSLTEFAKEHLNDYRVTHLRADPNDPHAFPGLEAVEQADLLILSVRRRLLSAPQMNLLRAYTESDKPLIALRTASHAFSNYDRKPPQPPHSHWPFFDQEILGARYEGHFKNGVSKGLVTEIVAAPTQTNHPLMKGLFAKPTPSSGSLYKHRDLRADTTVLLKGRFGDNEESIAWTFTTPGGGEGFYTSLGHPDDFGIPDFQQLLQRTIERSTGPATPAKAVPQKR